MEWKRKGVILEVIVKVVVGGGRCNWVVVYGGWDDGCEGIK